MDDERRAGLADAAEVLAVEVHGANRIFTTLPVVPVAETMSEE